MAEKLVGVEEKAEGEESDAENGERGGGDVAVDDD